LQRWQAGRLAHSGSGLGAHAKPIGRISEIVELQARKGRLTVRLHITGMAFLAETYGAEPIQNATHDISTAPGADGTVGSTLYEVLRTFVLYSIETGVVHRPLSADLLARLEIEGFRPWPGETGFRNDSLDVSGRRMAMLRADIDGAELVP
jgi:hypothetical protein